ncbi:MAG: S1C family serine protease [Planctomycetota bacterium]|nr:S1C family serine protease [Planctomycetota bacterium]
MSHTGLLLFLVLPAITFGQSASSVYEKAKQACFEVLVNGHLQGSGWMASKDGYAITAAHVVEPSGRKIEVRNSKWRKPARLVAVDLGHDIALLKVRGESFKYMKFARREPRVGHELRCFGTPLYRHYMLMPGKVAKVEKGFEWVGVLKRYQQSYYVAAVTPGGASGGPWLNSSGDVVGLQSGSMTVGDANMGISYLAPLAALKRLLKEKKDAATPTIGGAFEEFWEQGEGYLKKLPTGMKGSIMKVVLPKGIVANAGMKAMDVVLTIDGKTIEYRNDAMRYIRAKKPGEKIKFEVFRPSDKKRFDAEIVLGELEKGWRR